MALEIPSALIGEIQLALRRAAGVPSYDPADPSLPTLPTLRDAISAVDPSLPADHRCRRCRGGLVRGPQSTICIFCAADRRREAPPQTVAFSSTAAYRKLLQSLNLNGSETVEIDSGDSSKGQNVTKQELVLSDLLDLKLRWPSEEKNMDNNIREKQSSGNSYALNLQGVDLDTFFSYAKDETTTAAPSLSSEQLQPKIQSIDPGNHASSASQNFGSFKNLQSSAMTSISAKGTRFVDSFADWEADFQSASSETFAAEPKSVDLFQSVSSEKIASVEDQIFSSNNLNQDDIWSQMGKEVVRKADQLTEINETNNTKLKDDINYTASINDSWVQHDLNYLPGSSTKEFKDKEVDDTNDSFDPWQDFAGSVEAPEDVSNSWAQNVIVASHTKELSDIQKIDDVGDSLDIWQDFSGSGEPSRGLSNSWEQNGNLATSYDQTSGMKSVGLQDVEFGSFMHSDSPSGTFGVQEGSSEKYRMRLDTSVCDRAMNGESGSDGSIQVAASTDENLPHAQKLESNSPVEKLLSQMHDLSFMLDSNLSIPKEGDRSFAFHP